MSQGGKCLDTYAGDLFAANLTTVWKSCYLILIMFSSKTEYVNKSSTVYRANGRTGTM